MRQQERSTAAAEIIIADAATRHDRQYWVNSDTKRPAVETAATEYTKPTCVGWGESAQADLVPFVAANSFAEVFAKPNPDPTADSQTVPDRRTP